MSEHGEHHTVSIKVYLRIFFALMVLTGLTVWVAFFDLGIGNTFVAITIAVVKASLVVMFFMHLYYGSRILWVVAGAGFIWLVIMLGLTMSDIWTRQWLPFPQGW